MKAFKSEMAVLVVGLLAFSWFGLGQAEPQAGMTSATFAGILVNLLNLEMPAGTDSLSQAELFEVQSNMLIERGMTVFVDAKPDGLVTCKMLAEVLYTALKAPLPATIEEKIAYLAKLGYLTICVPDEVLSASVIINTLNIPELTRAIAEAYSLPGGMGLGVRGATPPAPSNPAPENPSPEGRASPIF